MKKIYYIIVGLCVVIFAYWIIKGLPDFSQKVKTITVDSLNSSSFSSSGKFGFKSTPERQELINAMININSKFIKNPPIAFRKDSNSIENFYKLEKFFTDFKYYYVTKLKIINNVYNELPTLYSQTASKSEETLADFFNEHTANLSEKWGITDFNDFSELVYTLKQTNGQKVTSCKLEDSYYYDPVSGKVNFRLELTLANDSLIYLGVLLEPNGTNAPTINFYGTISGGFSYV